MIALRYRIKRARAAAFPSFRHEALPFMMHLPLVEPATQSTL
jgi:hypothetical protein